MDKNNVIFPFLSGVYLIIAFQPFSMVHGAATLSPCSQTPYPELCNSFVRNVNPESRTLLKIRDSSFRVAMVQAELVHLSILTMDLSSFKERAKLAWADCLELFDDTLTQLNRSIANSSPNSANDVQTWLSAATTNQQTCQNGFIDFSLASHLQSFSFMLSNFTKLLSNSLALNKAATRSSSSSQIKGRRLLDTDFPEWVSAADRRLLQSSGPAPQADIVVAKDGSGNYKTISEAVAASVKKRSGTKRFVIHVKAGVYKENVEIKKSMKNLMFIGDGIDSTIITGSKSVKDGSTTFRSATVGISGSGFIARGITFENTAGPQKQQAVALRSSSDFSVFYSCSFKGYQDTLYVYSQRQFYRNCDVYGTVDFIFGDAVAVLQNCNIYVRSSSQMNTITAQGRSDINENTGIVIHNSRVTAGSKSYLGRPWKQYSRTVFIKTSLDGSIDPAGWLRWTASYESTLYYAEYMNIGTGASTSQRVKWSGYHVLTSAADAGRFTVGNFLAGNSWIPATGVPFTSGL